VDPPKQTVDAEEDEGGKKGRKSEQETVASAPARGRHPGTRRRRGVGRERREREGSFRSDRRPRSAAGRGALHGRANARARFCARERGAGSRGPGRTRREVNPKQRRTADDDLASSPADPVRVRGQAHEVVAGSYPHQEKRIGFFPDRRSVKRSWDDDVRGWCRRGRLRQGRSNLDGTRVGYWRSRGPGRLSGDDDLRRLPDGA